MRGGEKLRRGRFTGKEQASIHRRGKHGAFAGVARQRVGIGAARKGIVSPARFPERLQLAAEIIAEKRDDLVDRGGCYRAVACILECARIAAAEKSFDAGLA